MSSIAGTQAPVVVVARLFPLPEHRDDALAAVLAAVPGILAEDGCQLYAPHLADDGTILIIESWASPEALAAHGSGGAVQVLRDGVAGLMANEAEVTLMRAASDLPRATLREERGVSARAARSAE